jgi:hypothetical protein
VDHNLLCTEHLPLGAEAGAAARRVLREKKSPVQFWNPLPTPRTKKCRLARRGLSGLCNKLRR